MKKRDISQAPLDDLISAYAEAAAVQGAATESGDYRHGNKASDLISAIYGELRRRGHDAQKALLPLLKSPDPGVRLWSASHALEFAPSKGEPVLEALVPVGTFIGFTAKTTLTEWRKGRLEFP